jgi:hypothetical protein
VVDGHLVQLFDDEAKQSDVKPALTGDTPPMLHPKSTRTETGEQDEDKRWDVLAECRLDPQRPASGPYQRISDRKVSRTDPDACAMSMRDGRTVAGYQDHYLVDGGKARIILHAFVTPGDVAENNVVLDQLRRTIFRRKLLEAASECKHRGAARGKRTESQALAAGNRLGSTDLSWCGPAGCISVNVYLSRREADNICQLDDVAHSRSRNHSTFLQSAPREPVEKTAVCFWGYSPGRPMHFLG